MKTYNIEVQRFKSMNNGNGLITAKVDCLVLPLKPSEDAAPTTWLSMSEENARVLQQLLKAQLAEVDKRKARSQR